MAMVAMQADTGADTADMRTSADTFTAGMSADTDGADMDAETDPICRGDTGAEQREGEDGSEERFHGHFLCGAITQIARWTGDTHEGTNGSADGPVMDVRFSANSPALQRQRL
jgi:hypothetical protein